MPARTRHPLTLLLLAAALAVGVAHAQAGAPAGPHTGDAWVDARLVDIDAYAATYRDAFVDELVRYHRAPRELVAELLARPGWTPGDVYFACGLAMEAGRPCRGVADLRQGDAPRDWASIARELGVVPDSQAFGEFKRGLVDTYARWARPLPADAGPVKPDSRRSGPTERAARVRASGTSAPPAKTRPGGTR